MSPFLAVILVFAVIGVLALISIIWYFLGCRKPVVYDYDVDKWKKFKQFGPLVYLYGKPDDFPVYPHK
ncbi:MAG: hypothetical protein LBC18_10460 [Opitutaceae bacterium]|jgi:hypothetical protein|nr:hypothetical protein [Opitutaceae bacterium]